MPLPTVKTPTYVMTIPSTKEEVKFRPFLVKEEKALLIAQQSEDEKTMISTLKDVIRACTLEKLDVDKLAVFDIEYIFSQLRAKSVGEVVELVMRCRHCEDEKNKTVIAIDLSKIDVKFHEGHKDTIMISDTIGMKMKYPGLPILTKMENAADDPKAMFDIIVSCIDSIFDEDEVYHASEQSREELTQFIDNLTQVQFEEVQKFFSTMPTFEKELNYTCPACGADNTEVVRGLNNFF